jgi:TPR repeat protein
LEDGSAAIEQKDYKKAHLLLLPEARKGNAFAQYNVAFMYANGLGVEKNEVEAVKWYRSAAEQGDATAQANLGLMIVQGRGVKQDYQEGMKWYLKAAEHGNAFAQNNIGSLYFNGHGVAKDDKKAVEWYRKAATQGLAIAQNSLGGMYVKGWGVEKDVNEGLGWFWKAANQGHTEAQKNVYAIYLNEATHGNAEAMHNLATLCLKGWAGRQNPEECLKWYENAAKKGIDASRNSLAQAYEKGLFGIAPDKQKAHYWKSQIGRRGDP